MSSENRCRWDGAPGHYEVWYLTCNHRDSGTGYWIRYTLEAPLAGHGEPYVQLWFGTFDASNSTRTFGINRRLPIEAMRAEAMPFSLQLGDATLTDGSCRGQLAGDGHHVRWDLHWTPATQPHRHLPEVMYLGGGLGETTVLSPSLCAAITGTIEVDGRRYSLAGEPGGQTHLWGRKHAHRWAWGHCNAFRDQPTAAFESLTVQLERRGRLLPPLTIFSLYLDGRAYHFNQLRHTVLTRSNHGTGYYRFTGHGARIRIEGEFSCHPSAMLMATYADPDGQLAYCANTEVGDLRITVFERTGLDRFRERARLLAPGTGHFEVASRQRDPAIRHDHVTVDV